MSCYKISYSKKLCQTVLNNLLMSGNMKSGRIYECEECKAWHITHLEEYKNDESIGKIKFVKKWKKILKKQK